MSLKKLIFGVSRLIGKKILLLEQNIPKFTRQYLRSMLKSDVATHLRNFEKI